jgi:Protein of unknown function (DUF4232)
MWAGDQEGGEEMIQLITASKPARWVLSGMVLAGIACAVSAAASTAGAQTAATTTPRCKTQGLSVWLGVGSGGGAAGNIVYPLEFTNVSGHTCQLYGFPGVSAERAGAQVGSAAGRDHSVPARTVTLRNRATAHTLLEIVDVSAFPPASCRAVTANGLTVYPPGAFTAAPISFRFRACSAKGPVFLTVRAVRPRVGIPSHG